jgi:uncharacterized alpha-E superfamily protein
LEVLLQVADSSTTYRSRYLTSIRTRYVLELLLMDDANPRSVAYQVGSVAEHIQGLPRHERDTANDPQVEYELAVTLLRQVQEPRVDDLKRRDVHTKRSALEAHLRVVKAGVSEVSSALAARYLSHSLPSRLRSV